MNLVFRCSVFRWSLYSLFSVAPTKDKDVDKKLGRLATEIMSSEGVPAPSTRDGKGLLVFKRIQAHKSGPFDFEGIKFAQELSSPHLGPIWCMRFSHCGQLLATAGQVLAEFILEINTSNGEKHCICHPLVPFHRTSVP